MNRAQMKRLFSAIHAVSASRESQDILRTLWSNREWEERLYWSSGGPVPWSYGACHVFAYALQQWLGKERGEVVAVTVSLRDANARRRHNLSLSNAGSMGWRHLQHVLVKVGGWYVDDMGAREKKDLIRTWSRLEEGVLPGKPFHPVVGPYDPKRYLFEHMPRSAATSRKLASLLRKRLGPASDWSLS